MIQWRQFISFSWMAVIVILVSSVDLLTASAGEGKKESAVKVWATVSKPDADGRQQVTILLDIKKGHRILANPVRHKDFKDVETTVSITSAKMLKDVKVKYPPGKPMPLFDDEVYYVYEGKVEVKATIKRSAEDKEPIDVTVRFFPRNDTRVCLPECIRLHVK